MIILEYSDHCPAVHYIGSERVWDMYDHNGELCIKGLPATEDTLEIHFSTQRTGTAVNAEAEKREDGVYTQIPYSVLDNHGSEKTFKLYVYVYAVGSDHGETIAAFTCVLYDRANNLNCPCSYCAARKDCGPHQATYTVYGVGAYPPTCPRRNPVHWEII